MTYLLDLVEIKNAFPYPEFLNMGQYIKPSGFRIQTYRYTNVPYGGRYSGRIIRHYGVAFGEAKGKTPHRSSQMCYVGLEAPCDSAGTSPIRLQPFTFLSSIASNPSLSTSLWISLSSYLDPVVTLLSLSAISCDLILSCATLNSLNFSFSFLPSTATHSIAS